MDCLKRLILFNRNTLANQVTISHSCTPPLCFGICHLLFPSCL